MKTIDTIKQTIITDFMRNEDAAKVFGFTAGDNFETHFSKVSVENILFHAFAVAAWVLQLLFVQHQKDVDYSIEEMMPHRPKWYRDKVLKFMKDKILIEDTDQYDTEGMSESDISKLQVVKHAVASEPKDASVVLIKVAGSDGSKRCKLAANVEEQLAHYIAEVKDAGVQVSLVNIDADIFSCVLDVYYDAMLLPENVQKECNAAIVYYIENLPFNGEYTNTALVDILQNIEGVKTVSLKNATSRVSTSVVPVEIDAICVPSAGYFAAGEITINMRNE